MSSTSNSENLQLILASTRKNTMAWASPNSSNSSPQNIPKSGFSADSYISHFLSWQRNIMISPKVEESRIKDLHPYIRLLTPSNLDSCEVLERVAYQDSRNCASREKLEYRLSKCGELCQGLFCTVVPGSQFHAETLATSNPVETGRQNGALSVLLGYIIATKTNDPVASLDSMGFPDDWRSQNPVLTNVGHQENGRNVVIHSVAVLPGFRSRGIGKILVKSLMQQVIGAEISDRITIIAHQDKVAWYEKMEFKNLGPSDVEFGSGGWYDMVHEIGKARSNPGSNLNVGPFSFSSNVETNDEAAGNSKGVTEVESESESNVKVASEAKPGAEVEKKTDVKADSL